MLGLLFELIFEFVLEILFGTVGEVLVELGLRAAETRESSPALRPVMTGMLYAIAGAVLGLVMHLVLPVYLIGNEALRMTGRIITPIVMGFMLCLVSWIIKRRDIGEGFFRLDKFIYGVVFGASYSVFRYLMS
jgi:hypothetical protein